MTAWTRTLCRLLAALMLLTPWQIAQAGMIGTGETVAAFQVDRADVVRELQALGLEPAVARERVAALSDEDLRSIAGRADGLPAGADAAGILAWVIFIGILWYIFWRKPSP